MDDRMTLEAAAIKAALDLFGHSQSGAFLLPVPNTSPPLYLACGEAGDIAALLPGSHERDAEQDRLRSELNMAKVAQRSAEDSEAHWEKCLRIEQGEHARNLQDRDKANARAADLERYIAALRAALELKSRQYEELATEILKVTGKQLPSQSPRKLPTAADVRGILCDEPMEGNGNG